MRLASTTSLRASGIATAGILALIVAGCGSASSSGPGTAPSGGAPSGGSSSAAGGGSGTTSSGGTTLFPIVVGETWVYNDVVTGAVHGVVTDKVLADVPVADGHDVTISHSAKLYGLSQAAVTQTFVFHNDGSITVPFAQTGSGGTVTKLKSGSILWPSAGDIASGQPHTSPVVISVTSAGHTTTIHATVTVQGMGVHSVTVPAGTYNATLIRELLTENVSGFKVTITVQDWLAPSVGPVREQASTSAGSGTLVVQELKSYTK